VVKLFLLEVEHVTQTLSGSGYGTAAPLLLSFSIVFLVRSLASERNWRVSGSQVSVCSQQFLSVYTSLIGG
jgi:hypothetical protein